MEIIDSGKILVEAESGLEIKISRDRLWEEVIPQRLALSRGIILGIRDDSGKRIRVELKKPQNDDRGNMTIKIVLLLEGGGMEEA